MKILQSPWKNIKSHEIHKKNMKSNEIRANALNSITFHEIPKIVRNS